MEVGSDYKQDPQVSGGDAAAVDIGCGDAGAADQAKFAEQNDIGWAVKKKCKLSTQDRRLVINPWKPSNQKDFPYSVHQIKGRVRKRKLVK